MSEGRLIQTKLDIYNTKTDLIIVIQIYQPYFAKSYCKLNNLFSEEKKQETIWCFELAAENFPDSLDFPICSRLNEYF